MTEIRWAHKDDIGSIVDLMAGNMYAELGAETVGSLNIDRVVEEIAACVQGEGSIAAFSDHLCIGVLNLVRSRWWFSNDEYLCDQGFYVLPQARDTVGRELLTFARVHAETVGLPFFIFKFNPGRAKGRIADLVQVGHMSRL